MAFVSQVESKSIQESLSDSNWISAMQDELNQFTINDVWSLVPKTSEKCLRKVMNYLRLDRGN